MGVVAAGSAWGGAGGATTAGVGTMGRGLGTSRGLGGRITRGGTGTGSGGGSTARGADDSIQLTRKGTGISIDIASGITLDARAKTSPWPHSTATTTP
jgi:hypothetical protein